MKNAIVATMQHRDSKRAARISDIAQSIRSADEPATIPPKSPAESAVLSSAWFKNILENHLVDLVRAIDAGQLYTDECRELIEAGGDSDFHRMCIEALKDNAFDVGTHHWMLADTLKDEGKHAEALAEYEFSLPYVMKQYPDSALDRAGYFETLAELSQQCDQPGKAQRYQRRADKLRKQADAEWETKFGSKAEQAVAHA